MKNDQGIYLDNHATTAVAPEIVTALSEFLGCHVGNASSADHAHGQWARAVVDNTRQAIAGAVHAHEAGIIFTSGATEAANLVIRSVAAEGQGCVIVASAVEHPSILETARDVALRSGGELRIVGVDGRGRLDLAELQMKASGASLGCFMAANHEIGAIYPISRIGEILRASGTRFLCDATQAICAVSINMAKMSIDYLIFSGHKIHALQGVGVVACRTAKPQIRAHMTGGSQQEGYRPGTYNLPGIWSLGLAIDAAVKSRAQAVSRMSGLRDRLWHHLQRDCAGLVLTSDLSDRLPNNLHFCVRGIENTTVIERIRGKLSISTGSACSSGAIEPSRVLTAMRVPRDLLHGAFRIGLSRYTTEEEIEEASGHLTKAIIEVRALMNITAVR